jgi:exoribonuclease-2
MTRAEVSIADVDLLQLTAGVRILQIETPEVPESDASPA